MKIAAMGFDAAALGIILGVANHILPAVAALLGVIWYGFVIFDRIRYGPEVGNRKFWRKIERDEDDEAAAEAERDKFVNH